MKPTLLLLYLLLMTNLIWSQTDNFNLEFGNFDNWELDTGIRSRDNPDGIDWNQRPAADLNEQIELTTPASPQFDQGALDCMPTPVNIESVFPNGAFSARIGNIDGGRRTARISRTFTVTPQQTILTYSYAVILDDPDHSPDQQPKFVVNIKNASGNVVTCGKFEAFAGDNATANGFINCDGGNASLLAANPQILPWTTAAADLTPFIGQQITIEFITLDCTLGAHGGYAYVEADVSELEIDVVGLCQSGPNNITLTAPLGFDSYLWNTGETTRTINIPDAEFGNVFEVDLIANTGCNSMATITLAPVATATIDPIDDIEICEGGTVTIVPTGQNVGDFEFPELNRTGLSAVVSPTQDTTYTVIARDKNGCQGASTTVTIKVFPTNLPPFPDADFELQPVLTNTAFPCSTVQFTNRSQYCKNDLAYVWDFGDGTTSTDENPLHVFPDPVDPNGEEYIITLTATSIGDGNSDTFSLSYRNSNITPFFTASQISDCAPLTIINDSNICNSDIAGFPSFIYTWNFGDGSPEVTTDNTVLSFDHTYAISGTYTVTLAISDPSNPAFTAAPYSEDIEINVDTMVDFDFNIDCFDVQFTDTSIACEAITYAWDFGDGSPISTAENPLHTYTTVGPHRVTLTINNGTNSFVISKDQVLITPDDTIPDFDFTISCNEVTFLDRTNSCSNLTYEWDFADGSPISTLDSPVHTYLAEGNYQVQLTVDSGVQQFTISKEVVIKNEFEYNEPIKLIECTDNDAANPSSATFNLLIQTNTILGSIDPNSTTELPSVTYHLSTADAVNNINAQNLNFENSTNPQMLYARVEDNGGCFEIFSFEVEVENPPLLNVIEDILLCVSEINTTVFDFTTLKESLFADPNVANESRLTFYLSETNAEQGLQPFESINLPVGSRIPIYARGERLDSKSNCYEITSFNIRLDDKTTAIDGRCTPQYSNTLTPNGDGANDFFFIDNVEAFPNNEITIYNRWGSVVFQTKGYRNNWDGTFRGKELPVGNYYYIIKMNDVENTINTGYVTIIR